MLTLWIDADSRDYPQIRLPFDRGFFLIFFGFLFLPIYLYRTRGARGLALCIGFVGLTFLDLFVELTIYAFGAFR